MVLQFSVLACKVSFALEIKMAANNNESGIECELWDVDPNEISISAFDSIDAFKPKVYTKQVSFGKRKSFLCYSKSIHVEVETRF